MKTGYPYISALKKASYRITYLLENPTMYPSVTPNSNNPLLPSAPSSDPLVILGRDAIHRYTPPAEKPSADSVPTSRSAPVAPNVILTKYGYDAWTTGRYHPALACITYTFDEDDIASYLVDANLFDFPGEVDLLLDLVLADRLAPPPYDASQSDAFVSYQSVGIYTITEMEAEIARTGRQPYLVEGYIPTQSIALTLGDSGMGKSPLKYQLGLCVASGVPFFGLPVLQGRVLYLDFENSLTQSIDLAKDICRVLGLSAVPDNFRIWTPALSSQDWKGVVPRLVAKFHPAYVVIDTMSKAFPVAEDSNKSANDMLSVLKQLCGDGCTVDIIHHLKKSSGASTGRADSGAGGSFTSFDPKGVAAAPDDVPDIQELIKDSRGAGAIYNGSDSRFLVRKPRGTGLCEVELLGYRRVLGTMPTIFLTRVRDDASGDALGYARVTRVSEFSKPEYARVFAALPDVFRWKDLEAVFGNAQRSIAAFVQDCRSHGRVVVLGKRQGYQKLTDVPTGVVPPSGSKT
jgi:hypothetical protein